MGSVLIAYATTEGHTRKIAQQIGKWIEEAGLHVQLADASDPPLDLAVSSYDAVIVAGSIHVG